VSWRCRHLYDSSGRPRRAGLSPPDGRRSTTPRSTIFDPPQSVLLPPAWWFERDPTRPRVVAATNWDLVEALKRGVFQEGLCFRLKCYLQRDPAATFPSGGYSATADFFFEQPQRAALPAEGIRIALRGAAERGAVFCRYPVCLQPAALKPPYVSAIGLPQCAGLPPSGRLYAGVRSPEGPSPVLARSAPAN